jgi:hypothetical protein
LRTLEQIDATAALGNKMLAQPRKHILELAEEQKQRSPQKMSSSEIRYIPF